MTRSLEREQRIALRDFKVYIVKYKIHRRPLVFRLRFYINGWLAQPARIKQFQLDARQPHEVIAIADFIENDFRSRWAAKSVETRKHKPDPKPIDDPRIVSLF